MSGFVVFNQVNVPEAELVCWLWTSLATLTRWLIADWFSALWLAITCWLPAITTFISIWLVAIWLGV